ncbi:hypothetical protein RJ639_012323 [Escallonia herrerae]|uniref:Epidermal growth factor receptor substrate 15-like 1 n=1 Tax=Escallonia herrerae TaxID=1293975 RepID=A0AA89APW7_9ASTE|nr:hypothetical protein RJ639_012323 [Escallonia herrerae]
MAGQNQGGTDLFDSYFRRADLDYDGRISGAEAVSFFQGSNLSKQVLAQIWMHADQNRTGFLGRAEFYNALKLVTVAQSKRDLTPDIVKAALYGPASAKIPAPQINLAAVPGPQVNSVAPAPAPQMGAAPPPSSQNSGFRGQMPPNANMNQQYFPSQGNQSMRPPLPMHTSAASHPLHSVAGLDVPRGGVPVGPGNSNLVTWPSGIAGGAPSGATSQAPNRGISPSIPSVAAKPQDPLPTSSSLQTRDPKALVPSGNGFSSDSIFGGDVFSATESLPTQASSAISVTASSAPASSAITPVTTGLQSSTKSDPLDSLQSAFTMQSTGGQLQQTHSAVRPKQQVSPHISSSLGSSGVPVEAGNPTSNQSQIPWPKMTRAGVQKYGKVFLEVDTDRDGRITGEQARNLFLSWRLPRGFVFVGDSPTRRSDSVWLSCSQVVRNNIYRDTGLSVIWVGLTGFCYRQHQEILKQVWDLSDQDNDGMLSLREFCVALYLMERYREGRPLPPALPSSVLLDEILVSLAGPPSASYGSTVWGPTPGLRTQQGMPGAQPMTPAGLRPPIQTNEAMQFNPQSSRVPSMDNSHVNKNSKAEQNSLDSTFQEAAEAEKRTEDKEKMYLDSREKIEFYRNKMQDLVLYKSRCDNRLNEITERALADKHEAELLAKKYEEKYKQVAEVASKLTIEEASFRDTQERKTELHQAIVKMEQGGSADGILQVRADRIQSDLEELLRALTERCKKHGVHVKSTALIELPPGWQPGIPEVSAVWDEDWDKFEDEGFSFDVAVPENGKSASLQKEISSPVDNFSPDSLSNGDGNSEKPFQKVDHSLDRESAYTHSEDDSAKSPPDSPARQIAFESPSQEYSDNHNRSSFDADTEIQRSFDEPTWGTFDTNDDIDSVWGFNPTNAKDSDYERQGEKYFFESSDFGGSPGRTASPQANSIFHQKSPFSFEDSVPSSPLSRAGNSPLRYSGGSADPFFDNISRYDSFSTHDHGSSPQRETFARFDSISSTTGFDHSRGFSFDDSDPFGSSGPFKVSSESQNSKKGF